MTQEVSAWIATRRSISRGLLAMPEPLKKCIRTVEPHLGHPPGFVIVSTGRAGSMFMAHLLTGIGIPCAHEGFFRTEGFKRRFHYLGDSSWLAVPYLEDGALKRDVPVIHQVRHPLEVITSLYGTRFFDPERADSYRHFARAHFQTTGEELRDCMRWWTQWNRRCEQLASITVRVEDTEECLPTVLECIGRDPVSDWRGVSRALIAQKVNTRARREVAFKDLPCSRDREEMVTVAARYGYVL